MKYKDMSREDKLALLHYLNCLKETLGFNIDCELYDSPSLYIMYLDDDIFDSAEDKIDDILNNNYTSLETSKEILISPKSFKASYEEKIEDWLDVVCYENVKSKSNLYNSNHFHLNYKTQEIKTSDMSNDSTESYRIEQKQGITNEHNKAA